MKRRPALALTAAAAALLVSSCGGAAPPAAVVRDEVVTLDEVSRALEEFEASSQFEQLAQQGDAAALRRTYEQNFLAQQIRRLVLRPEAEARGIEVSDADVEERIEQIKGDFPSEKAFEEALAEQGYGMQTLRDLVYDSMLEERLRGAVVEGVGPSEADVRARYEEERARFTQYRASHILVTDNARALDIAGQLRAAPAARLEALFARLARRYSKDPGSAAGGGDLGWSAPDAYVEPFAQALGELDRGEVSNPVRTDFGFHIILLKGVRIQPFEEVSAQLRTEIAGATEDEVWGEFLRREYEEAAVEVNPRFGMVDPITGRLQETPPSSRPGAATPPAQPTPTGIPAPPQ